MILTKRRMRAVRSVALRLLAERGYLRTFDSVPVVVSWKLRDQLAMGLYYPDGSIHIPVLFDLVSLIVRVVRRIRGHIGHESLLFVLAHEYGHALEFGLGIQHSKFRCFGSGKRPTTYAETNWTEDFAESFAVWATGGAVTPARARAFESLRREHLLKSESRDR